MLNLILTLVLSLANVIATPTIAYHPGFTSEDGVITPHNRFEVSFSPGADGACTVFKQLKEIEPGPNWPDGHYTPRNCWFFDRDLASYDDAWGWVLPEDTDWDVSSSVFYPLSDGTYKTVESNHLILHW